jgi:glycine/serine hydroxymethyltransferase
MSVKTPRQYYDDVLAALQDHHRAFNRYIPLIASENVPSPAVREALATDFGNRYVEGCVGERVVDGEDPKRVQADAAELRSGYEKVQYCFENATKAYEYMKIR